MADPLSITASVAGVASLGYSIAKGLYQIADDMSVAGLEVRVYANEIDGFAKLLLNVQHTVDGLTCSAAEIAEIKTQIKAILDNCDRILKPLREVQEALLPLLQHFRNSPSKLLQVALRVRWTFVSKGKVMFYRELLQRQHQMLDTHLARATLVSVQYTKQNNPLLVKMLHASLENSVSALNYTIASPTASQAQGQAQLLLGYTSDSEPSQLHQTNSGAGLHPQSDGLPVRPKSSQGVAMEETTSTAIVVTRSSYFCAGPEPALTHLTEHEAQAVRNATNLDIDDRTMTSMEKILDDTEDAEHKAVRMASNSLSDASGKSSGGSKDRQSANLFAAAWNAAKRPSSAVNIEKCGEEYMGGWSHTAKRMYRAGQMRFDVIFKSPVFFVCPATNSKGPVPEAEVLLVTGTDESIKTTFTSLPGERIHDFDSKMSTWVVLLQMLQRMERDSMAWESHQHQLDTPVGSSDFSDHTLCVAVQAKARSWDAIASSIGRPYATTTISHLVEMAAMLGIYWKEFDRSTGRYRAEGNGYILTGSQMSNLGLMFKFQICGMSRFQEHRIIPSDYCKELAFGLVPTIFRNNGAFRRLDFKTNNVHSLNALVLGSYNELVETLVSFGCNIKAAHHLSDNTKNHGHLFPLAFEITGMLGRTIRLDGSLFRSLPNPTPYQWNKKYFSMRKLLQEYNSEIIEVSTDDSQIINPQQCPKDISDLLWNKTKHNQDEAESTHEDMIGLPLMDALHHSLDKCDRYLLLQVGGHFATLVVREHIQEPLRMVNDEGEYGSTNPDDGDRAGIVGSYLRYDDVMTAPPEEREKLLMEIYFRRLRPRVAHLADVSWRRDGNAPQAADGSSSQNSHSAPEATSVPKSELLGNRLLVYIS